MQFPPPPHSMAAIAVALGARLEGDGDLRVRELVHPLEVAHPDQLVFAMDTAMIPTLDQSPLRALVVAEGVGVPPDRFAAVVVVSRPRWALAILLELFDKRVLAAPGVHASAVVDVDAEVAEDASVGPFVHVAQGARVGPRSILLSHSSVGAGSVVGADCLLHPGVRLGERVQLGDRVIVHANAVIGADGFSFVTPGESGHEAAKHGGDTVTVRTEGLRRMNSIGTVVVGDDVEIGAGTTIDRASLGATTIGEGSKIDNLVQIGHNCSVGRWCLIAGTTALAGSVRVGDRVTIAGGVGVSDHVTIGDDAVIAARSGVWNDVPPNQVVAGYPARPKLEALEREQNLRRLPRIIRDVAALKRRIEGGSA